MEHIMSTFVSFIVPQEQFVNINDKMEITVNSRTYKCMNAGRGKNGTIMYASCKEQNIKKAIAAQRGLKRTLNVEAKLQSA